MRKCDACGYLLFGEAETCKHCGAPIAAPTAVAAAAWPSSPPPAPAPGPAPGPAPAPSPAPAPPGMWSPSASPLAGLAPPPPSVPPPAPDATRNTWQQPPPSVITTAPPKSTRTAWIAAAIVLGLLVTALGGAVYLRGESVPAGTSAFVHGNGVPYTAADGSYSAQFPQQPTVASRPITSGSFSSTMLMAVVSTPDYQLGTASMPLPNGAPPGSVDAFLNDVLLGALGTVKGEGTLETHHVTHGGLPAMEGTTKAPDGDPVHVLAILEGNTLYIVLAHAKTGSNTLYRALVKSFVPTAAG